mmetsp:Transcript_24505/g.45321  ORF Transcript_24505/g.45321 Transcript_24505/m.45321 type:complete len:80 (+) Transcript_24505:259-498(+)
MQIFLKILNKKEQKKNCGLRCARRDIVGEGIDTNNFFPHVPIIIRVMDVFESIHVGTGPRHQRFLLLRQLSSNTEHRSE